MKFIFTRLGEARLGEARQGKARNPHRNVGHIQI
jgi:hypothetical protein